MTEILNLFNKILGFGYVYNVFKILSVRKKYLNFANSKSWV